MAEGEENLKSKRTRGGRVWDTIDGRGRVGTRGGTGWNHTDSEVVTVREE